MSEQRDAEADREAFTSDEYADPADLLETAREALPWWIAEAERLREQMAADLRAFQAETVRHIEAEARAHAEIERLWVENAALRAQIAGHCQRIASQSDALSRAAEKSPTARLEAWDKKVMPPGGYRRHELIYSTGTVPIAIHECDCAVVLDEDNGEQPRTVHVVRKGRAILGTPGSNRYVVVEVGTDEQPATLDDMILAALKRWEELYGEHRSAERVGQ